MVHVKASGPLYNDVATQGSKLSFTSAEVGLSDEKKKTKSDPGTTSFCSSHMAVKSK